MVVILLSSPLQPQSDTKVVPDEKSYTDDWWQIQCRSVSRMRNKEALVHFIYKPA